MSVYVFNERQPPTMMKRTDGWRGEDEDEDGRKITLEKEKPKFQQETGVLFDET